ncbi:RNA polymerase sigma factor [Sphingobacterium psychroaquaticum]|uniref:RNA polymerase sigma-70 factor, ECF subfamily n=1 Tax=Sphingobacterium psychroaquaticum TaxID=561061 RepID=A0A1X7JTK9_9SPHI|nr:sigma-70 family RNA polymerase sigma factor [Sphingobacterium psychroaquaticum]QBQ41144.1 sigma-70 family RNA polymerase sigma factor [Sphingobacterium psychroaquaticum]SMG31373.1 RNA polymerase sigma-70 factor, ECF subfamily [Sphingobacterium psychroaquaticum]
MKGKLGYRLLWERIRNGDESAFFDLYSALYKELVNFGIRTCGDVDVAGEATDQVFVTIWEKRENLDRVENVQSYLMTFLKRKMLRLLEKQHKINTALQSVKAEDDWIEMPYEEFIIRVQTNEIIQLRLKEALEKLSFRQKQLVHLKFFEGMGYEQIAEATNMTVKTAYNTLYDALKVLREELKEF